MLPELFEKIHEPTVHCFAAVYIPDVGMDGKSLVTGRGTTLMPPSVCEGPENHARSYMKKGGRDALPG